MKNNNVQGLRFLLCVGLCVVMGALLIGIFSVQIQAAAFEEKQAAEFQEITLALPRLPAPEAPAMPYPYSVEGLAQEQKEREEHYALQKQLHREEVQRRREQRGAIQEEEFKEVQEGKTQTLLCFLDDSEIDSKDKNNTAILKSAMGAMMVVEVGSIIISGSLLANSFNEQGNHNDTTRVLVKTFYDRFDSRNWVLKKVDNNLFLLIPIKTFSENERQQFLVSGVSSNEITNLEYKLGLRVNHMETVRLDVTDKNSIQTYFVNRYDEFLENARSIGEKLQDINASSQQFVEAVLKNRLFVPIGYFDEEKISDYRGENIEGEVKKQIENKLYDKHVFLLPKMVVYLTGHGDYGKIIADISIDTNNKLGKSQFQQLLDYFATKIKTKLVVVDSCYAAGFNAQKVLSELKEGGSTKIYPFHLVILATGDAPTWYLPFDFEFNPLIRFDIFIQKSIENLMNLDQMKRTIFSLVPNLKINIIPQWRPAKSALWIPLSEDDKAVIRIGKTMVATRKKPLFIAPYIDNRGEKRDPRVILLAAEDIPFDIIIDSAIKKIPAFVSIMPGEVTHTMKNIVYKGEMFNLFDFIGDINYSTRKTFKIEKLFTIENDQDIVLNDLFIDQSQYELEAFCLYKNKKRTFSGGLFDELCGLIAFRRDPSRVSRLLSQLFKEDINNYRSYVFPRKGMPLLHYAVEKNNKFVIEELLKNGVNINAKNAAGYTALHLAAFVKHGLEIVKLLLENYYADPFIKSKTGLTVFDVANRRKDQVLIDYLSQYKLVSNDDDIKFSQDISQPIGEG